MIVVLSLDAVFVVFDVVIFAFVFYMLLLFLLLVALVLFCFLLLLLLLLLLFMIIMIASVSLLQLYCIVCLLAAHKVIRIYLHNQTFYIQKNNKNKTEISKRSKALPLAVRSHSPLLRTRFNACERVASNLRLSGCFSWVVRFPPPLNLSHQKSRVTAFGKLIAGR